MRWALCISKPGFLLKGSSDGDSPTLARSLTVTKSSLDAAVAEMNSANEETAVLSGRCTMLSQSHEALFLNAKKTKSALKKAISFAKGFVDQHTLVDERMVV